MGKGNRNLNYYITLLRKIKESEEGTLSSYCKEHPDINRDNIRCYVKSVRKNLGEYYTGVKVLSDEKVNKIEELLNLYKDVCPRSGYTHMENPTTSIETDDRAITEFIKDDDDNIIGYYYKIFRHDKTPIEGQFTKEEMDSIYRMYSWYGDGLTQRQISRYFPNLSLLDFKRVLRAFNITKASAPFAPHMFEEHSEEELREIQARERENSFLRKAEEDRIRDNERLLRKYAQENIDLKKQVEELSNFKIDVPNVEPYIPQIQHTTDQSINLYLADMHLGATVTVGTLYKENVAYGEEECKRRLEKIIQKVKQLGPFNNINLILMGDNVDCCGIPNMTYKRTHYMPENMDPKEQVNSFIKLTMWFIDSLYNEESGICNKMNVYSVPNGNHGSNLEYVANKALIGYINVKYPGIHTTMWEEFYGIFRQGVQTFVCMHGRDAEYMKRGFPLELNDNTKVKLYEWLHYHGVCEDHVHFIKGDLHSANINSCMRLDYRNVLSLFGASDYSSMNYGRNSYGMSYDIIKGSTGEFLLRGEFENV